MESRTLTLAIPFHKPRSHLTSYPAKLSSPIGTDKIPEVTVDIPPRMPGEEIDRPNPTPQPSHIDDAVLSLAVNLEKTKLDDELAVGLREFQRAANYIAVGK